MIRKSNKAKQTNKPQTSANKRRNEGTKERTQTQQKHAATHPCAIRMPLRRRPFAGRGSSTWVDSRGTGRKAQHWAVLVHPKSASNAVQLASIGKELGAVRIVNAGNRVVFDDPLAWWFRKETKGKPPLGGGEEKTSTWPEG